MVLTLPPVALLALPLTLVAVAALIGRLVPPRGQRGPGSPRLAEDIVGRALGLTEDAVARAGVSLDVEMPVRVPEIVANPARDAAALAVLVRGALRRTVPGARLRIRVRAHGGHLRFEVNDDLGLSPGAALLIRIRE